MGDTRGQGRMRVLVADDEHLMATFIGSAIRSLGHIVVGPCSDGVEALQAAAEHKPHLAMLDVYMHEMDGLTTATHLWEQLRIPSVIISAYSNEECVAKAPESGVFGYLLKPVSEESIKMAICVAMARAQGHTQLHKRVAQLEQCLADRRIVEQAKWTLVTRHAMSEGQAHALLQQLARSSRKRLSDVAQGVLDGSLSLPAPVPGAQLGAAQSA